MIMYSGDMTEMQEIGLLNRTDTETKAESPVNHVSIYVWKRTGNHDMKI